MVNCRDNTTVLREGLTKMGKFDIVSKDVGVPMIAFSLKDSTKYTVFDIAESLRRFGWILPAYTMPANAENVAVLRVVVREDFNRSLAERLLTDIEEVLKEFDSLPSTKAAVLTPATGKTPDEKLLKKSVKGTQGEVTWYWKRLVDGRRAGAC